jgi:hypothetical protein
MRAGAKARSESPVRSLEPRGLSREAAAAYAGCESLSTFHDWVRRNILPGPIPGTHIWDKKAIDAALDRASGLSTTEMSALEQWKKNRERERVRQAKTPVPLDQDPRKR